MSVFSQDPCMLFVCGKGNEKQIVWEVDACTLELGGPDGFAFIRGTVYEELGAMCQAWSRGITFILPALLYN